MQRCTRLEFSSPCYSPYYPNPDWFAESSVGVNKEVKEFKADPTIAGMKRMLTELCTKEGNKKATTKTAREKRKLTALLDSDDENEDYSKQKRKKDKHKKTNEPLAELETEEEVVEDTSTAKNEKEKADNKADKKKKKSKKNKK